MEGFHVHGPVLYGCSLELYRSTQYAHPPGPQSTGITSGLDGRVNDGAVDDKTSPQNHSRYDGGSRRESRRVGTTSELSCPRKVL